MRGKSGRVKEEVANAIAEWLPAWGLPAPPPAGVRDLNGQAIRVAKFTDSETCRFFFSRRTIPFQQRMTRAVTRMLSRRGAKIFSVRLTVEDYARWLDQTHGVDSAELRYRFATAPPEFQTVSHSGSF